MDKAKLDHSTQTVSPADMTTSSACCPGENENRPGADIRALRKSRSLTLHQLAQQLNRSVGFISQLERGLSAPSIADLRNIADYFDVPVSLFFGEQAANREERGFIVRANLRRRLGEDGTLVEELLSPDLGGSFEIIRSVFAPGAEREEVTMRKTEEAGYIISGTLELEIDGRWFELGPGDSFRHGAVPVRWRNRGKEQVVAIWVISPPVY